MSLLGRWAWVFLVCWPYNWVVTVLLGDTKEWNSHIHTVHIVPSNTLGNPAYHTNRTLYHMLYKKISVLSSWRWALVCPKHVELILKINKTVIVASSWFSYLLYLHWWRRSNTNQVHQNLVVLAVTVDIVLTLVIYRKKGAVSFGNSQRREVSQATESVGHFLQ
jgi:hypothetical protein